jgi:Fe-S cluster assembly protein SufD
MVLLKSGIRFTFGAKPQRGAASIVLSGAGTDPITVRVKSAHPAKVRIFLLSAVSSAWKFAIQTDEHATAFIEYYLIGTAGQTVFERSVAVSAGASLQLSTLILNGGDTSVKDRLSIIGEGGILRSETLGVLSGEDSIDAAQTVRHEAPNSVSDLVNSLVASDASQIVFDVTGAILKGKAGSRCKQQNRGVLLGEKASIEVSPKLLIDEYDVEAGHGCAIGRINADELFYLSSRGLDPMTAKRLVVSGYTAPYVQRIDDPALRRLVETSLLSKIGGAS